MVIGSYLHLEYFKHPLSICAKRMPKEDSDLHAVRIGSFNFFHIQKNKASVSHILPCNYAVIRDSMRIRDNHEGLVVMSTLLWWLAQVRHPPATLWNLFE